VIAADQHPHFTVINEFRLENLEAFVDLFLQVLNLCGVAGLLDLKHVSLDGSKVRANASKHKARSFRRFSLRGLDKVRAEWTLVCLCGNLLKLVRSSFALEVQTVS